MKLRGLLQSAGLASGSPFWAWALTLSDQVEQAAPVPQYMQVRRNTTDQSFAAVGDVVFNDVPTDVGGLAYNSTTGQWTLDANSTYELEFFGWFANFGGNGDIVQTEWVNAANTPLVTPTGSTFGGYFTPGGLSTLGASNKPVMKTIYRTGNAPEVVKVRITNITSTADLQAGSHAIVRKIG